MERNPRLVPMAKAARGSGHSGILGNSESVRHLTESCRFSLEPEMVRAQIKIPAVHGLDCVQALRDRPKGNVCVASPNSRGEHIDSENLRLPRALVDHFDMALVAVTFTKLRRLGKFQRRVVGPRYFCFPKM